MKAVIKQDFDYSSDGLTLCRLKAGEVHEISDSLFPGLLDARLIERVKEVVNVQPVVVSRADSAPRHNRRFDDRRR